VINWAADCCYFLHGLQVYHIITDAGHHHPWPNQRGLHNITNSYFKDHKGKEQL